MARARRASRALTDGSGSNPLQRNAIGAAKAAICIQRRKKLLLAGKFEPLTRLLEQHGTRGPAQEALVTQRRIERANLTGQDPTWPTIPGENRRPLFFGLPGESAERNLRAGWPWPTRRAAPSSRQMNTDQEFLQIADALMQELLTKLDTFDPDELEADSAAGVIKMSFASGGPCVLNRQTAAHQIWLAEGATAWHFERDIATGDWMDTKGRGSLRRVLSDVLTKRLGRPTEL